MLSRRNGQMGLCTSFQDWHAGALSACLFWKARREDRVHSVERLHKKCLDQNTKFQSVSVQSFQRSLEKRNTCKITVYGQLPKMRYGRADQKLNSQLARTKSPSHV